MCELYQFDTDIWINDIKHDDYEIRNLLITDPENAIIWDTQSHPDDTNCFLPHIKDRKISIIYSHADWDHIWGTSALPYENAEIIGHNFCLKRFSEDVPVKLFEKIKSSPLQFKNINLLPPTRTFSNVLSLSIGSVKIELYHLPGHTSDSIVAFFPEKGLLLMGDSIETPFPFVPPNCMLTHWIEKLKNWQGNPCVKIVIPSHGPIGGIEEIEKTIKYLENLKNGIENKLANDISDFYYNTHRENLRNVRNID